MGDKVSIVIPVYNMEQYLEECLDSVIHQSFSDLEIICVDNCSTDASFAILQDYAKKDPRFLVLQNQKNRGLSYSRNRGASLATGEYLYFLDSDDFIEANTFELAMAEARKKDLDLLLFGGTVFYESPELEKTELWVKGQFHFQGLDRVVTGQEMFETLVAQKNYMPVPWISLVRREFYEKHRGSFPEGATYCEDSLFTFRNLMSAQRVSAMAHSFYHYRIRGNSSTTKEMRYVDTQSLIHIYMEMLLIFANKNIPKKRQEIYLEYFFSIRFLIRFSYRMATGKEPTKVEETMVNLEQLLLEKPLQTIPSWEEVKREITKAEALCFFGAGKEGGKLLTFFQKEGFPLPKFICDNGKAGTFVQGIPVVSLEEALAQEPNLSILISNTKYYFEILHQISKKIPEDRILYFSF